MSRYVIGRRPVKTWVDEDWWDKGPLLNSLTVDDHEAVDTGLITETGEPIMRLPEAMGFHNPRGE